MTAPARVLVVDDSPTILKVVSSILSRHGYEPTVARDGLAGMEVIKKGTKVDLVLLDFVMPRMNGYQFCRELRSSAAHRALPVVLMSAKGDKIRGQFVQQTGAVDAITKPFDSRALVAVVEGALSKTAEGRARPVPEGQAMPDEDTIIDSEARPSLGPRQMRQRAAVDFAQQLANVVAPAILSLSPAERGNEAAVLSAVAHAMTAEVIGSLAASLKEADGASKEAMSGDLGAIPLAEVLQMLHLQRQTGVLRVTNNRTSIAVWVRQGLIDLVQSRGAADEFRLGRYFVQKGVLTRERLDAALASIKPRGGLLGQALVEQQLVTKTELADALSRQSSELIYDVLRWPFGRFSFSQEPFPREAEAQLGLAVSALVLEGFRRVDEWRLMEETINFDQVVYVNEAALEGVNREKLSRSERLILGAVDGARTVSEIVKESAVGSFDAIKILYQFLQSRVLRTRQP